MSSTTPDALTGQVGGSPPARPARARRGSQAQLVRRTMLFLVVPSIVLVLLINAYPFVYAANQSLHNGTLISAGNFVGFGNYRATLSSGTFWTAAEFTLLFTVVGVFGSWAVGLGLALLLRSRLPGRGVFKVLLLLPWIVPTVVSATSWNYLVATPQSPIVELSGALGFGHPLFLANAGLAKLTVCVFKVWISFPFMMLMTSAALASVDHSVYEAARMDGASGRQQFTNITLPIIARSTYISWILMTIFCVNDFPTIYLLTGGGPVNATTSLVVLAYQQVFKNYQVGSGVSIAFIMTLTLIVVSVVLYRQIKKAAV